MRTGAVRLEARAELVQQRSSLVVSVPGQSAVGQGLGKDDGIPSLQPGRRRRAPGSAPSLLWTVGMAGSPYGSRDHRCAAIAGPFVGEEVLDHGPGPSPVHE